MQYTINEQLCMLRDKSKLDANDIAFLERLSKHEDDEIRYIVAELLIKGEGIQVEDTLVSMLNDKSSMVRASACDSLCESKNILVLDALKERVVKDSSSLVRSYAVLSIGDIAVSIRANRKPIVLFLKSELRKGKVKNTKISFFRTLYLLGEEKYLDILLNEMNGARYQNRCATVNSLLSIIHPKNIEKIKETIAQRKIIEKTIAVNSTIEKALSVINESFINKIL